MNKNVPEIFKEIVTTGIEIQLLNKVKSKIM